MQKNTNDILRIDKSQKGILRLILDDPSNKNALSKKMMTMLKNNLTDAAVDNSLKVIVIEAVGDVFCSGHNLKDITMPETMKIMANRIL